MGLYLKKGFWRIFVYVSKVILNVGINGMKIIFVVLKNEKQKQLLKWKFIFKWLMK